MSKSRHTGKRGWLLDRRDNFLRHRFHFDVRENIVDLLAHTLLLTLNRFQVLAGRLLSGRPTPGNRL
jgi:hypothetical protein